jgi:flagellar basal-body rod protein FlgB
MDRSFRVLHKIVQAANARQKVISSNIANADTPGYKAKDIKFGNFLKNEVKLATTSAKHISSTNSTGVNGKIVSEHNPSWGDRNNVELNVEVAKMTENSLRHSAAVKILNSKIRMFKNAIKGR